MRTIQTNIYHFSELSENAKQKAIEHFRESNYEYDLPFQDEVTGSLNKFCEIFNINYRRIDYLEPHGNDYKIELEDSIKKLSGVRLLKYIVNNYWHFLFKSSYIKPFDGHKNHKRIKNYTAKHTGKKYCFYYSSFKYDNSCTLTGVCYDNDILDPIYNFLKNPSENINFEDLLNDCISSLCSAAGKEYEYQNSNEAIIENIEANEYEFDENGDLI